MNSIKNIRRKYKSPPNTTTHGCHCYCLGVTLPNTSLLVYLDLNGIALHLLSCFLLFVT